MKLNKLFVLFILIILFCTSCFDSSMKDDGIYAIINTTEGKIICKLYYDKTPVTVGNFIGLAEGTKEFIDEKTKETKKFPFYNGLLFHRVIEKFVIQTGCPNGDGTGGPGYQFVDEFHPDLVHDDIGILSMANSGPNTNGSQFFITLGKAEHLNGKHTVFGKVVKGMDVVRVIGDVKTDEQGKPYDDVYIKKIKIKRVGKHAKAFNAAEAFALNEEKLKEYNAMMEQAKQNFYKQLGIDNEENLIKNDVGLKYIVKKNGLGKKAVNGSKVKFHMIGSLEYGMPVISSYAGGKPFEHEIGTGTDYLRGLDMSLSSMRVGEQRVVILPYYLAFGEDGYPPQVPPKATIILFIELIEIL